MYENLYKNIKKLCKLDGISGRENEVREEILNDIKPICDSIEVDTMGNIIAFKKGKQTPKNKIMLSAHMDEVGFIVTAVTDDGYLKFGTVGGINSKVINGRRVKVGDKKIVGIIGTKPVHQQNEDERSTAVEIKSLTIDIGAKDKEDALKYVSLGDSVTFEGVEYTELGENSIMARAIDDRAGCAILIEIMKSEPMYDAYYLFCVQEEVGLNGAKTAAYTINPDISIVVETTASGDVAEVTDYNRVSVVGGGAVITYMDMSTIYDKQLYDLAFRLSEEKGIKAQTKTMIAGGNDAGAIHISRGGVKTVAVSIPGKYIHSAASVVSKADVEASFEMTKALLDSTGDL